MPQRVRDQQGGEPFALGPADILWLQRLPTDPAAVTYEDAVALAGLANKVQRGSGDERLIRSIWEPVKHLHDRRDAEVDREAARRPLPGFPRAEAVDAVDAALASELDQLTDDERRARAEQIVDDALATRTAKYEERVLAADYALEGLDAVRDHRHRLHEAAPDAPNHRAAAGSSGDGDRGRTEAARRYGVPA